MTYARLLFGAEPRLSAGGGMRRLVRLYTIDALFFFFWVIADPLL